MALPSVVCFSHLRWEFVFQRPQHLMSRFARSHRVFFVEEAVHDGAGLEIVQTRSNVHRVVPHLPCGSSLAESDRLLSECLAQLRQREDLGIPLLWFYTPMMAPAAAALPSRVIVYDCMDELASFAQAPPELREREQALMRRADVVFTGGMALYEAKRRQHPNVHGVPSSVDFAFFARARGITADPPDQEHIPHPRLGFHGVLDERFDPSLVAGLADAHPDWQIVLLGPVVKIPPESLPRRANIHYLGRKPYEELPSYVAGWDVAIMPFALNPSTRYISPTKTPEFLAAGRPVVSTAIRDVCEPYERRGLVRIGRDAASFAAHVEAALRGEQLASSEARDAFLAATSWDRTFERMYGLLRLAEERRTAAPTATVRSRPPARPAALKEGSRV